MMPPPQWSAKTIASVLHMSLPVVYYHWRNYRQLYPEFPRRGMLTNPQVSDLLAYIGHRRYNVRRIDKKISASPLA